MATKLKFELEATARQEIGKGASRRLRHQERIPGVVYGGGKAAAAVTFEQKALAKALEHESFYSHIITLKTGTDSERAILKDVQRHPYKPLILHVDFQRVRADEKLHLHVPLHFVGGEMAPGVKEGGLISHILSDVEVSCLPDNLPEYLELDISQMQLNQILHLSDIKLPAGVESVALAHGDDKPVVSIHIPRVEEEPVAVEEVSPEVPAIEQKDEAEAPETETGKKDKGKDKE